MAFPWKGSSLCVLLALLGVLVGCQRAEQKPPLSPELQTFVDKFNQIQDDMTEEEVDAILVGYPTGPKYVTERDADYSGMPLERPVRWEKRYGDKAGATEGDHVILILFDESARVVTKAMKEYCR